MIAGREASREEKKERGGKRASMKGEAYITGRQKCSLAPSTNDGRKQGIERRKPNPLQKLEQAGRH